MKSGYSGSDRDDIYSVIKDGRGSRKLLGSNISLVEEVPVSFFGDVHGSMGRVIVALAHYKMFILQGGLSLYNNRLSYLYSVTVICTVRTAIKILKSLFKARTCKGMNDISATNWKF